MTGEISLHGNVKPIGGVNAKISAAKKAGVKTVIVPKENWQERFNHEEGIKIIPVTHIKEVIDIALMEEKNEEILLEISPSMDILTAESI